MTAGSRGAHAVLPFPPRRVATQPTATAAPGLLPFAAPPLLPRLLGVLALLVPWTPAGGAHRLKEVHATVRESDGRRGVDVAGGAHRVAARLARGGGAAAVGAAAAATEVARLTGSATAVSNGTSTARSIGRGTALRRGVDNLFPCLEDDTCGEANDCYVLKSGAHVCLDDCVQTSDCFHKSSCIPSALQPMGHARANGTRGICALMCPCGNHTIERRKLKCSVPDNICIIDGATNVVAVSFSVSITVTITIFRLLLVA